MASPSVTWTFTNGTTSDASQVNTNFTNLISAMTDGTRDFSIGTLAVTGAVSLNGTVALGDASADDLTFNGSVASTIPVKTNATYNFGSATAALLSIYLGNGANKTMRLLAGTVGTSWSFTYPDNAPATTGMGMIFNASGTASFRYSDKFTATKVLADTGYTGTGDETIIPVDASSGSVTINLPAVASYIGKSFTIIRVDSTMANTVIIDANSTETILPSVQSSNLTFNLYTQYESVTLKGNGTSWYVTGRYASTVWTTAGALTITGSTSNPSKGSNTINADIQRWRREGCDVFIQFDYQQSATSGAGAGSGDYLFALPSNMTIDTTLITVDTTVVGNSALTNALNCVGVSQIRASTTNMGGGVFVWDSTHVRIGGGGVSGGGAAAMVCSAYANLNVAAISYHASYKVPISGWNP